MKKTMVIIAVFASALMYAMDRESWKSKHTAILSAKYGQSQSKIHAYYFPEGGQTRALVENSDGTYERPFIYKDNEMQILNKGEIGKKDFDGFLEAWEKHVKLGLCVKLALNQNN
jgi:hypothetical protein